MLSTLTDLGLTFRDDGVGRWPPFGPPEFEDSIIRRLESEQESSLPPGIHEMVAKLEQERHKRAQFPVGAFFDSLDANRHVAENPQPSSCSLSRRSERTSSATPAA